MKKLFCLSLALLLSSCSHRIVRTGYDVKRSDYWDCPVPVKKKENISSSHTKIGEIKLGECRGSKNNTEAEAMELLKKEGCALNADLVNIIDESSPELSNTCYQCRAEFYVTTGHSADSPDYKISSQKKKLSGTQKAALGVGLGVFILGVFLFGVFF